MSEIAISFEGRRGVTRYVDAFREHWLLIALIVVLAVGGAGLYLATATKQYKASADILIEPFDSGDNLFRGFHVFRQPLDGSSAVVTALRVLSSKSNTTATQDRLRASCRGTAVSLTPLTQADIVTATATSSDPECAAAAANAFASVAVGTRTALFQAELAARLRRLRAQARAIPASERRGNFQYATLQQNIGELQSYIGSPDPTIRVLTRATAPTSPSWPRPLLSLTVAGLASLLLGGGLAVALEVVNPRVSREDELRLVHRLPVLARIPRLSGRIAHGYLSGQSSLPADAWKGYRTLRAVLATAGHSGGLPRSIMITSASPSDGKTMTSVNLAIMLASADLNVILVDGDLHRPMIGSIFNVSARRDGLVRLLSGWDDRTAIVPAPGHPGLRLVLANREQAHQLHLLNADRFSRLVKTLEAHCDVVVVDSPPLPEVAEALSMASAVETVLISVRLGHTRRDKLAQLRELLMRRGVSPLGFVVTTRERTHGPSYGYDYAREVPAPKTPSVAEPRERIIRAIEE